MKNRLAVGAVVLLCLAGFFLWSRPQEKIIVPALDLGEISFSSPALLWPYKTMHVDIEHITANFKWQDQPCDFTGSFKNAALQWHAVCPSFNAKGTGALTFAESQVQEVDLEIEELTFPDWQMRRSEGWLSLTWQQGWQMQGEIDAGFLDMQKQSFAQQHLTLQQDAENQTLDFRGIAVPQQQPVSIISKNNKLNIVYADQTAEAELADWQEKLAAILAPKVEKTAPKIAEKQKPKAIVPQVIKTTPTSYRAAWDDLVKTSIFLGFHYTQALDVFPQICMNDKNTLCKVAHGHKGVLTYSVSNPPSYFGKISDAQQRLQLQNALYELQVQRLRLYTTGEGKVTRLVLRGKTPQGQAVQLDLNVEQ